MTVCLWHRWTTSGTGVGTSETQTEQEVTWFSPVSVPVWRVQVLDRRRGVMWKSAPRSVRVSSNHQKGALTLQLGADLHTVESSQVTRRCFALPGGDRLFFSRHFFFYYFLKRELQTDDS